VSAGSRITTLLSLLPRYQLVANSSESDDRPFVTRDYSQRLVRVRIVMVLPLEIRPILLSVTAPEILI
jgi:hypothetical protein